MICICASLFEYSISLLCDYFQYHCFMKQSRPSIKKYEVSRDEVYSNRRGWSRENAFNGAICEKHVY